MFNQVILSGRLTADPELKQTQNGIAVTSFTVAVARPKKKDAEAVTDFINCVAWRMTADFITKYFKKGNMIGIVGSIQTRSYTDKYGNKRTAFELIANDVQFIEGSSKTPQEPKSEQVEANLMKEQTDDDDWPF